MEQVSEKNNKKLILELSIPNLKTIKRDFFPLYDRLIIGYPFCPAYPDNPSFSMEATTEVLDKHGRDIDIVISLPVCPMEEEMGRIEKVLASAKELGAHGIEVHSFGLLRWAKKSAPGLNILAGEFSDIYTAYDAKLAWDLGAKSGIPACEIDLDERIMIQKDSPLEVITVVAGIFPIAFSRYCHNHPEGLPEKCTALCSTGRTVVYGPEQKVIQAGRVIYSGRALDLLSLLPELRKNDFKIYRINGFRMSDDQIIKTGEIFKNILARDDYVPKNEELRAMESIFPEGSCNGFYYGARGLDKIGPGPGLLLVK
ncbi:MAG: U32 family peptidase [Candidatus Eremiobacteraeota bacterium]|nr:U32 family peptidase [Candidatus Eremiobacteraeota bacterium]